MLKPQIDVYMGCDAPWEEAKTVLFGAPFDSTTSNRPGTRFGPSALRRESYGLELYSPYQDKDLSDCAVLDSGDLELPMGSSVLALEEIEARAAEILSAGKRPFLLGGEHLVTLGAFRAVFKQYPDVHIIHFDAHADLRQEYLGVELSHACVLRRCWDLTGDGRIFQFGIRSGDRSEWQWGRDHVTTHPFDLEGLEERVNALGDKSVYFTVDLDVLDPSVFPGTGTPEPGGVSFEALRRAVTLVCSRCNVVGCDVNELSPPYDPSGVSNAVAAKIVREMLLALDTSKNTSH
ncbi:agmatinase [Pseudoflavonifractor sp. AF19-9AC]|uniref:agmatinase n=1 Tax=Pseudoflavonifractor sp. AF19-9AC TaxID=2292244 RepID=UPI000E4DA2D9|nr:agmatinase [Pseudoflavonifractor sp. AF19-9AC]RHR10158.1 agmatinase [Pseudoflavonifractor sp. AF19-9AC]